MIFPYSFLDIVIRRSALESIRKGLSDELIAEYKVEGGHFDKNLL